MEKAHTKMLEQMLEEFYQNGCGVLGKVDEKEMTQATDTILQAKKIYVLGIGHSGFFGRIFAMKLNHVGLRAYTIFDEINPPFDQDDLFIAISQSGGTKTILALAEKAKKLGGSVLAVTSNRDSALGRLADAAIVMDRVDETVDYDVLLKIGDLQNQNFLGALFGFNIFILFYTIIIMLAERLGESADSINARHANLQ
jgi:6-phospho-3-hexuloisomerase